MNACSAFAAALVIIAAVGFDRSAEADSSSSSSPIVVGQAGVTDGDTIRMGRAVVIADGKTRELAGVRIRFFGIDAPEKRQTCLDAKGSQWPCGDSATRALAGLVRGKEVTCQVQDIDRYKRLVAVCS